jgi:hypothetical protein
MQNQSYGDRQGAGEQDKVDKVLAFVSQRPLRQNFLQLAGRHQAAGNGQAAENDFEREHRHHEARDIGRAQVELGGADESYAERAKGVTERSPLRHRCHRHAPERNADDGAEHQPDGDPPVVSCRGFSRVPPIASTMPISPAQMPWRAVVGELIHFSERMNSTLAMR